MAGAIAMIACLDLWKWLMPGAALHTVATMTKPVPLNNMKPGDVLGESRVAGHAMIVVDMALNEKTGGKIYLLAQGYMPAQDMHIVINTNNNAVSPWYELNNDEQIPTPEWLFIAIN